MIKLEANLSLKSLNQLVKEIENYQNKLKKCEPYILKSLADYTQERAKYHLKNSILHKELSTGNLLDSIIQSEIINNSVRVYTNLFYAKFVEYGTGVRGLNSGYSTRFGSVEYDLEYLKGQSAHKFMWNALEDLESNYIEIARNVLRERGLI